MKLRFVEANDRRVLDDTVTLASGLSVYNAMRVSPNGSGSEQSMVVLQTPPRYEGTVRAGCASRPRRPRPDEASGGGGCDGDAAATSAGFRPVFGWIPNMGEH
jgi:hypothetical protein